MKIRQMGAQLPMQTDRYEEANSRFSQFFELARKVKAVTVHSVKEYWGGKGYNSTFS